MKLWRAASAEAASALSSWSPGWCSAQQGRRDSRFQDARKAHFFGKPTPTATAPSCNQASVNITAAESAMAHPEPKTPAPQNRHPVRWHHRFWDTYDPRCSGGKRCGVGNNCGMACSHKQCSPMLHWRGSEHSCWEAAPASSASTCRHNERQGVNTLPTLMLSPLFISESTSSHRSTAFSNLACARASRSSLETRICILARACTSTRHTLVSPLPQQR